MKVKDLKVGSLYVLGHRNKTIHSSKINHFMPHEKSSIENDSTDKSVNIESKNEDKNKVQNKNNIESNINVISDNKDKLIIIF